MTIVERVWSPRGEVVLRRAGDHLEIISNGTFLMDMNATAAFAQDDFRVASNLSFNVGLRYELNYPATERRDHMANLDLSNGVASPANQ